MAKRVKNTKVQSGSWVSNAWIRMMFRGVFALGLCVIFGWGIVRLLNPNTLPIRTVQIQGEFQHLTTDVLQNAVRPDVQGGFFTVDVHRIQATAEQLPWVETAAVRRVWPNTVRIQIVEQLPISTWNRDSLLNDRGESFSPPKDEFPQGLPALIGPKGLQSHVLVHYRSLQSALSKLDLSVAVLTLSDRGAWGLKLDNELVLRIGRDEYVKRLRRFIVVYPSVLAPRLQQIQSVDLRYTNGFALRWKNPPSEVEAAVQEG